MNFDLDQISYSSRGPEQTSRRIIDRLSLTIRHGECVGIIGQEGSGKTTLLNLLGGLISPDSGKASRTSGSIAAGPASEALRLAFTFQFPDEQFLCQSVRREFQELLALRGISSAEADDRMTNCLRVMGLDPASLALRSPFSLSLGESRRVACALAVALKPEALLMDEPTSGLDAGGIVCAHNVLKDEHARGVTIIVATHDLNFIAELAGRILILENGRIAADGPAEKIIGDQTLLWRHGYGEPETTAAPDLHTR